MRQMAIAASAVAGLTLLLGAGTASALPFGVVQNNGTFVAASLFEFASQSDLIAGAPSGINTLATLQSQSVLGLGVQGGTYYVAVNNGPTVAASVFEFASLPDLAAGTNPTSVTTVSLVQGQSFLGLGVGGGHFYVAVNNGPTVAASLFEFASLPDLGAFTNPTSVNTLPFQGQTVLDLGVAGGQFYVAGNAGAGVPATLFEFASLAALVAGTATSSSNLTFQSQSVVGLSVPEPGSLVLLASAGGGLIMLRKRNRSA